VKDAALQYHLEQTRPVQQTLDALAIKPDASALARIRSAATVAVFKRARRALKASTSSHRPSSPVYDVPGSGSNGA
jgi:hypothetical protein